VISLASGSNPENVWCHERVPVFLSDWLEGVTFSPPMLDGLEDAETAEDSQSVLDTGDDALFTGGVSLPKLLGGSEGEVCCGL
jgi:hypothetical protein